MIHPRIYTQASALSFAECLAVFARLPDAISAWAPLPGRPPKRGIAGSMLVDRLRDHDRKRWDRRRMGDFKPGTEETPGPVATKELAMTGREWPGGQLAAI